MPFDATVLKAAWVGLGGNLGDVPATFASALALLAAEPGLEVRGLSPNFRTAPWGIENQPAFINAVVALGTALSPDALLDVLQRIERAHGRDRAAETRWGPRTLDLDLLAVEGVVRDDPALTLPHPRIAERAFVLVPWAALSPELELPGLGRIADLRDSVDCSGVEGLP